MADVERLVNQWAAERPDLDLETMLTAARLLRALELILGGIDELARRHGVSRAEGDILFTLRRAGPPYRLSPTQLSESLLVASGTLTSRLDRLEARGAIRRVANPADRRSMQVELTEGGRKAADAAVTAHVANEQRMLAGLTKAERKQLDGLLAKLLDHLEQL